MNRHHRLPNANLIFCWTVTALLRRGFLFKHQLGDFFSVSSGAALPELFTNDFAHGFMVHLTFHPGDNIEVSKRPGFETAFFKLFDFL